MTVAQRGVCHVVEQRKDDGNSHDRQCITVLCREKHNDAEKRAERRQVIAQKDYTEPKRIGLGEMQPTELRYLSKSPRTAAK